MSNREELFCQAIMRAEEEAQRERLARLPMADWWDEIKETVVRPIFTDAVNALKRHSYPANQLDKNGKGILLQAGSPCINLELNLEGESIRVTSSASGIKPSIWDDRNHITDENVTALVNRFLEFLAKQTVLQDKRDH